MDTKLSMDIGINFSESKYENLAKQKNLSNKNIRSSREFAVDFLSLH